MPGREYKNSYRYHHTEELIGYLNDYKKDPRLIEQAELALVDIRIENEEADLEKENNPDYDRPVTSSHYFVAEEMFYQIKEVQEKIKDYNGKILILDS